MRQAAGRWESMAGSRESAPGRRVVASPWVVLFCGLLSALTFFLAGMRITRVPVPEPPAVEAPVAVADVAGPDLFRPVRKAPDRFPAGSTMPACRESMASGAVDLDAFDPTRELIRVTDDRVWWESEHDVGDTEDDHEMHRACEVPFRRLVELVCEQGAVLKVQDAYRPAGIHNRRSLHKEGRALDLTAEGMTLTDLARLCWAAGFDWVYFEYPKGGVGAHIHVSVRSSGQDRAGARWHAWGRGHGAHGGAK